MNLLYGRAGERVYRSSRKNDFPIHGEIVSRSGGSVGTVCKLSVYFEE